MAEQQSPGASSEASAEDSVPLPGLRNSPIAPREFPSVTNAQLVLGIVNRVTFAPWEDFDGLVESMKAKVEEDLQLESHRQCQVLDEDCKRKWFRHIAENKVKILNSELESEADLCMQLNPLLNGLTEFLMEKEGWYGSILAERGQRTGGFQDATPISDSQQDDLLERLEGANHNVHGRLSMSSAPPSDTDVAVNLKPDFSFRQEPGMAPNFTIEVKPPNKEYLYDLDVNTYDANRMSEYLNEHFEYVKTEMESRERSDHSSWLFNAISQTILQAMHTRSGIGCLLTYNHCIGIKDGPAMLGKGPDSYKFVVFVSGLFGCNTPSTEARPFTVYEALLALIKESRDKSRKGVYNSLVELVRSMNIPKNLRLGDTTGRTSEVIRIMDSAEEGVVADFPRPRPSARGGARGGNRGDLEASTENRNAIQSIARSKGKANAKDFIGYDLGYTLGEMKVILSESQAAKEIRKGKVLVLNRLGMRQIFGCSKGIRKSGASGVVTHHRCEDLEVAVKKWNGNDERGLVLLQREISMYLWFWKNHKEILGEILPGLLAVGNVGTQEVAPMTKLNFVNELRWISN